MYEGLVGYEGVVVNGIPLHSRIQGKHWGGLRLGAIVRIGLIPVYNL